MISLMIHSTAHVADVNWIDAFSPKHVHYFLMVHFSTYFLDRVDAEYCVVIAGSVGLEETGAKKLYCLLSISQILYGCLVSSFMLYISCVLVLLIYLY